MEGEKIEADAKSNQVGCIFSVFFFMINWHSVEQFLSRIPLDESTY
jgi:hypothetical protein